MFILLLLLILFIVTVSLYFHFNKKYFIFSLCKRISTVNGDDIEKYVAIHKGKTIFGNNFDLFYLSKDELFALGKNLTKKFLHQNFISYIFTVPFITIVEPEYAEYVFTNSDLTTKGLPYSMFFPFLGEGLLTSSGKKWHQRRKLLTSAFHFSILQKFLETFRDESKKMMNIFENFAETGEHFCLPQFVPKFTLNNICETALGVNSDDIGKTDEYLKNINVFEEMCVRKFCKTIYHVSDKLYSMTNDYKISLEACSKIHNFSNDLINKRRNWLEQNNNNKNVKNSDDSKIESLYFRKERKAMLDTLLEAEAKYLIDHYGICEEVDTFMFEGFDTTSLGVMFTLLMLALHNEVQEKCYQEILEISDTSSISIQEYSKLRYLDCVIKETLRLYPPVPFIIRHCEKETVLGNLVLPKRTNVNILISEIHRNPNYFNDPEKFDPNRFLYENSIGRHPFSFVPFSAGPRNCIGQKFALLEIKVLIVDTLRKFKLLPISSVDDIVIESGFVLRSKNPLFIKIKKRST